jgi:hypothetical protein
MRTLFFTKINSKPTSSVKPTVEGAQHKNMRLWDITTGEEVASFSQKSQEGW